MPKTFNDTGVCIPGKHYMVDISAKLADIFILVEQGHYFVINRPRQYGEVTGVQMELTRIADRLFEFTSGYPFPGQ